MIRLLNSARNSAEFQRTRQALRASVAALLMIACGSGSNSGGSPAPTVAPVASSAYGITARVEVNGHPEQSGWVRVPPVDAQNWSTPAQLKDVFHQSAAGAAAATGQKSQASLNPGLRTQATVQQPDGGTIDTTQQDTDFNYAPGWSLLYWATAACFKPPGLDPAMDPQLVDHGLWVNSSPWREVSEPNTAIEGYYIFGFNGPRADHRSCDAQLVMQETLLCAADHLAQLGDSPGTVTWGGSPGAPDNAPGVTVTIPPQRTDDVFIARDMALNAIAHLIRLDTERRVFLVQNFTYESTCTARYANLGRDPNLNDDPIQNVVSVGQGSTYFDPVPLTSSPSAGDLQAAGARRLARKAKVLAGAARLTKDLIERSVQDDVSGAQQKASADTDAHSGMRQAWGADATGTPYNSMRHALRTLFGRLEIGNNADPFAGSGLSGPFGEPDGTIDWIPRDRTRDDPQCSPLSVAFTGGGVRALDLGLNLPALSARLDDVSPKTNSQASALSLLDRAGIILPGSLVTAAGVDAVNAAVIQTLTENAATTAGYTDSAGNADTAAFLASDAGASMQQTFNAMSKDDMVFALQRVWGAFRMLTQPDQDADPDPSWAHSTLTSMAANTGLVLQASSGVDGLGGVVVHNGLPRDDLSVDPLAGMSRLQHLSSCGVYASTIPVEGPGDIAGGPIASNDLQVALGPNGNDVTVFQNPFFLAQGFQRQLAMVAEEADAAGTASDVADFARLASSEVQQWAGPGTLLTEAPQNDPDHQNLYLVNISLQDLGVKDNVELKARLALVSSSITDPDVIANCLAGVRKTCPPVADMTQPTIFRAAESVGYADTTTQGTILVARIAEGLPDQTLKISFPTTTAFSRTPGSYVVLLPKDGTGGQVLGWLRTPDLTLDNTTGVYISEFFAESYSTEQRRLAASVFGIGNGTQTGRSCSNFASLALPQQYCVEGMQRNEFVPLANELNSNSSGATSVDDSWKNYLDIAQAAADKADQLGEQLITEGLQSDLRKEAATEELGNLCGSYVSVDAVAASGGQVTVPPGDSQLSQCVKPDTTDIVYLRDDPFAPIVKADPINGETTVSNQLRDAYCRGLRTDPPFCARDGLVTHAGLGFATGSAKPSGLLISDVCKVVTGSLSPVASSPGGDDPDLQKASFGNAISQPWATSQGVANALQGLHLEERADNQWSLAIGSRVIMGSDDFVQKNVPTPSQVDVWPFCVAAHNCSDLANFVKDLFPPLTAPNDTSHAELRSLLESTIFYMGALAGELPAGTIRMPVLAANRSNAALTNQLVPSAVMYSQSYFEEGGLETPGSQGNLDPMAPKNLYTITDQGYTGKVPWDNSEFQAMGYGRTFSTPAELAYLDSRVLASDPTNWRNYAYQQARAGDYLYIDTSNSALEFDPSLVSGAAAGQDFSRNTLQAWLTDRGNEFAAHDRSLQGDPNDELFLQHMQEATYLTAPGKTSDDTTKTPPPPYKLCKGPSPSRGRSVCAGAPVSPTFYYGWALDTQDCDAQQFGSSLQSTIYAQANTSCVAYSGNKSAPANPPLQPGQVCKNLPGYAYTYTRPTNNGWFDAWNAVGSSGGGDSFSWNIEYQGPNQDGTPRPVQNICGLQTISSDLIDTSCPSYNWTDDWGVATGRGIWQDRLKPSVCPPEQRMELFLDTTVQDRVFAMQTLVRALGVSCLASNQHVGIRLKDLPIAIQDVEDINVLEGWLTLFGYDVDQIANVLYLVDVPSDVVKVAIDGSSDVGAVASGERGKDILDLESKLSLLENGFSTLGSNFQQLSGAIHKARLDIEASQLATQAQSLTIAGAKIDNDRQRAKAYVGLVVGYAKLAVGAGLGPSATSLLDNGAAAMNEMIDAEATIADSGIDLGALDASDANLVEREKNVDAAGKNAEAQAVLNLSQTTTSLYQSVNDTITGLKTNNNGALTDITTLKQNSSNASIALAKASGADFMSINGNDIPNHVNTVYRRQFDLTKQRYDLAIQSAKRAAYLARLSIEQRLGVRLDELHQDIGPLEAPATWVDSVCTVQGVNYDSLRQTTAGVDAKSAAETDTVKGFANEFIGDYIDKLRQFVQFYNVQFPFVDSSDTAVVSLREDLPGSLAQCIVPSTNLLLHSDDLTVGTPDITLTDMVSHGGWRVSQCSMGTCLQVNASGAMVNGSGSSATVLTPPGGNGRATLLQTIAAPSSAVAEEASGDDGTIGTGGAPDAPPTVTPTPKVQSPAPAAAVFQTVSLQAGLNYVLSWWDMAREPNGGPITVQDRSKSRPYLVSIFDANWSLVASNSFAPEPSVSGTGWSERRLLQALAPADGEYHIVFTAGPPGEVGVAVAIANVQLENGSGNGGDASPYEANGATVLHTSGHCDIDSPDQFRTRFTRKCDSKGCYFELNDVLNIDTQVLNQGASSLLGKLAPGNYNYRNNTIALNVVGTGVIDCSRVTGSSCNGSAYVQYDLDHIAYNVPVEDYEGGTSCFDFGVGSVKGGKALASERFLTLPLGSGDQALISQSPFLKPEFSGRPLSGAYRLRIHDEPQLVWRNVDDIQLVMNYGYWSRVARSPGN